MSVAKHQSESRTAVASSENVKDKEVVIVQVPVSIFWVNAVRVGISSARADLPKMVRETAKGTSYLIASSKNPEDEGALLISPSELKRMMESGRTRRTMGQLLKSMPFAALGPELIVAEPLADDVLPAVRLPD